MDLDTLLGLRLKLQTISDVCPRVSAQLSSVAQEIDTVTTRRGCAFLGPTGSGKSTILNDILACSLLPTKRELLKRKLGGARATTATVVEITVRDSVPADMLCVQLTFVAPKAWMFTRASEAMKLDPTDIKDVRSSPLARLYSAPVGLQHTVISEAWPDWLSELERLKNHKEDDPISSGLRALENRTLCLEIPVASASDFLIRFAADAPSLLVAQLKVDGRFPKSQLPTGTILLDVPGSFDNIEARERARVNGLIQARRAVIVCEASALVGTKLCRDISDLLNYGLHGDCAMVIAQLTTDDKERLGALEENCPAEEVITTIMCEDQETSFGQAIDRLFTRGGAPEHTFVLEHHLEQLPQ